jgi:D-glycero-alpha-D-manno-heptose-7-phosphate kinase
VLSTAIDKFIYIVANPTPKQGLKLMYSEIEQVEDVDNVRHPLIRETLKMFDVRSQVEIGSFADIPTRGTGLGSSSTFTVGLVRAISELTGRHLSRYEVAEAACTVEIEKCGEPIGKQDQYAAAFGGLNFIRFHSDDRVEVSPINVRADVLMTFKGRLMMFFTGRHRSASAILAEQSKNVGDAGNIADATARLVEMAHEGHRALTMGRLHDVGTLLHESWLIKKSLASGISDGRMDDIYAAARKAGAVGGKVLGAGGGGYFLFYVPDNAQDAVRTAMQSMECREFDFALCDLPAQSVYATGAKL